MDVHPLHVEQRKIWATLLLGHSMITTVPDALFHSGGSNRDFLDSLEPFIQKQRMWHGQDHDFNQAFAKKLREVQLELRKRQLILAEIEIEKPIHIFNQQYEVVAELRDRQKKIQEEINWIGREVMHLKETLPFFPGLLHFHLKVEILLNACFIEQKTAETLNLQVNDLIQNLQSNWQKVRQEKQQIGRQVLENMQDWHDAIHRLNATNTKGKK